MPPNWVRSGAVLVRLTLKLKDVNEKIMQEKIKTTSNFFTTYFSKIKGVADSIPLPEKTKYLQRMRVLVKAEVLFIEKLDRIVGRAIGKFGVTGLNASIPALKCFEDLKRTLIAEQAVLDIGKDLVLFHTLVKQEITIYKRYDEVAKQLPQEVLRNVQKATMPSEKAAAFVMGAGVIGIMTILGAFTAAGTAVEFLGWIFGGGALATLSGAANVFSVTMDKENSFIEEMVTEFEAMLESYKQV